MIGDKWTLLIVRDLAAGPRRFVELQRVLPGISTEQLRSRLNRMVADGMLTRKRYREVPPRVDYELTQRAIELMPILGELARWGYEWAWSTPRPSESVDIGAIFRLAPGLLEPDGIRGTVQCIVTDGRHGTAASYLFSFEAGGVTIVEHADESCAAKVRGDTAAWIRAFSPQPERDLSALRMEGDVKLAQVLLDGLALSAPRSGRAATAA